MGSGLKINYEKSNIMHLDERNMMGLFMERIIGCSAKTFPIRYLGVPIREIKLKKED